MKKLILISAMFSFNCFAECPTPLSEINIDVNFTPLKIDYSKASKEMQSLEGQYNPNLLGLFNASKQIRLLPLANSIGYKGQTQCGAFTKVSLEIVINPIIYISKEAQMYQCTKQRTEQHENLHFQFEVNAASKAKPIIKDIIYKYFSQTFEVYSRNDLEVESQRRSKVVVDEVNNYFKKATESLHAKIDTQENYKYESSFCSYNENVAISNLLRNK